MIHEKIGLTAAKLGIGHLYLYGTYAHYTLIGAIRGGMPPCNIYINDKLSDPQLSIDHILKNHYPGEIILFKASHKLRLDKIADMIKEA
jgi:UDP-N-acetylmuramyl pentapeptide synthase